MPRSATDERRYGQLVDAYNESVQELARAAAACERAKSDPTTTQATADHLVAEFARCEQRTEDLHDKVTGSDALKRARDQYQPVDGVQERGRNPLAFTVGALEAIQDLFDAGETGRVISTLDREERAAITTALAGGRRQWASAMTAGPRLLHMVAGVPQDRNVGAVAAQHPVITLPTAAAGVAETVSLAEFASSTAGSVTLLRFGRWTDITRELQISASVEPFLQAHQLGIARDLDKVLIDAVETAAGGAVGFVADVPGQIRKQVAAVIDNTAATGADDVVILVNPADASLIQAVSPTGGVTIGERFERFAGAIVYPSAAVNTGFMTIANLRAGTRYIEAEAMHTEERTDVKTAGTTIATWVIAGYAIGMTGGFAIMQDVVTP